MKLLLLSMVLSLGVVGIGLAGPARPIGSSNFLFQMPSGPSWDSTAQKGQWFLDPITGTIHAKDWEFHDDDTPSCINGIVQSITLDASNKILAFTVLATVNNNLPSKYPLGVVSNSHYEVEAPVPSDYSGIMMETRLVAEFAVTSVARLPSGAPPYFTDPVSGGTYYIEAVNEPEWAWYCWTPGDPQYPQKGDFQVPTWVLGNIPPGASASVLMQFQIVNAIGMPTGMPVTDYRHGVITASQTMGMDVLFSRHTSLKISHWLDTLLVDYSTYIGAPFGPYQPPPPEYIYASDASVFFERELDFGDAPDTPYPTKLANNGARHVVTPAVCLGPLIDAEPDGQPNPTATGDDNSALNDEDGVIFTSPLIPGSSASVSVTCSTPGFLSAWIDFNGNGSWADPGDPIFAVTPVGPGLNSLIFTVPASAGLGTTFARFRFTTRQAPITYTGLVEDGEVEDYQVLIEEEEQIDFGDARNRPTALGYPTLLVHNGARHTIVPGIHLGTLIDAEPDGLPDPNAKGDDNANLDDEDGVVLPAPLIAGSLVNVQVIASTNGYLNAWIDWNNNETWIDSGEHVYVNTPLTPGLNNLVLSVPVPPALVAGGPHTRWRFTRHAPAAPSFTGHEDNGEVEDYEVHLQVLDFGDAPDFPYPTRLASNGARHMIPSSYYLGATPPDLEPDGLPDSSATGDDTNGSDDEDGVTVEGSLICGSNTTLRIVASTNGWLNAWIDFNQNGSWGDLGDQIATDTSLVPGTNSLTVSVPSTAALGQTYGRFRFSSYTGLLDTGIAYNGEVEDYAFTLYQTGPSVGFAITNITCFTNGTVKIKWEGESPVVYEAQYTDVLTNTTWTPLGGYVVAAPYEQTDSSTTPTQRFYRVSAPYTAP